MDLLEVEDMLKRFPVLRSAIGTNICRPEYAEFVEFLERHCNGHDEGSGGNDEDDEEDDEPIKTRLDFIRCCEDVIRLAERLTTAKDMPDWNQQAGVLQAQLHDARGALVDAVHILVG